MTKTIQESTNMVFNYSRFHYFDKNGNELILSHHPDVKINILNGSHPEFPAEYALVKSTPDNDLAGNSSLLPINVGMRFGLADGSTMLNVSTYVNDSSNNFIESKNASILNGACDGSLRISAISDGINDDILTNLINATHSRLEKLESINGATSSGTNDNSFVSMINNIGDPDVILISLGRNDSLSNVKIGNFDFETDDLNINLFAPSYINGIKELKKKYKHSIIICLSFEMGDEYADTIRVVSKYTDCRYVDMRGESSIYTIISKCSDILSTQYKKYNIHNYSSSFGTQNYPELLYNDLTNEGRINFLDKDNLNLYNKVNFFPTYSFKSRMEFEKVSTELVETQVIYVLVENEFVTDNDGKVMYTPVSQYLEFIDPFRNEINKKQSRINVLNSRIEELEEQIRESSDECDIESMLMEINACKGEIHDLTPEIDELANNVNKCLEVSEYIKRFKLMFFIDGREQQDFRLFKTKYDELSWSDRYFLDLSKHYDPETSDNGYSANIGFSGKYDGVYQQPMYVCLVDTYNKNSNDIGEVYPIGEIMLNAEAEGEDERYRTFLSNFGIPDPKEYNDIFSDTDINDDLPDYVSINKNSKKMMLAYSDIFPYIGSYKALINAVKFLGYDDIFFKEWYKEIGNSAMDDSGYTTYDISYSGDTRLNTIENTEISERIHLRKLNWISMLYKLNEELDAADDKFGFPTATTIIKNYNTDRLAKLISLKDWIDRYATGVNCKVIDISGEGLVFERYNLQKFGSYQRVLDYTNENAISPVPVNQAYTLDGGSANIDVDIYTNDHIFMISDLEGKTFLDFCEGYFDETYTFNDIYDRLEDNKNYRYFGKTFDLSDNVNTFQIRARGEHDTYRFGFDFVHKSSSMSLLVDNDSVIFDYTESDKKYKNTIFTKLPIIQIEKGVLKKYVQNDEPKGLYEYHVKIDPNEGSDTYKITVNEIGQTQKTYDTQTVPTFIPPKLSGSGDERTMKSLSKVLNISGGVEMNGSVTVKYEDGNIDRYNGSFGLRYTIDNVNGIPCFKFTGYEEESLLLNYGVHIPKISDGSGIEYFVEILNGRMIFDDTDHNMLVSLNFSYNEETERQRIYVTTMKKSDQSTMYEYKISDNKTEKRFNVGTSYDYFINGYDQNPGDYIFYNNRKCINVNHSGSYQIDAILYDKNNNVFAKTSDKIVNVLPSYSDILLYINESKSGNTYGKYDGQQSTVKTIVDMYQSCIMGYTPKYRIEGTIQNNILKFAGKDDYDENKRCTGSTLNINKEDYDFANISSFSDRLDIANVDSSDTITFVKKSTHKSHITPEDNTDNDFYDSSYISNSLFIIGRSMTDIISDLNYCYEKRNDIGNMFAANLYIYDEVNENLVGEFSCVMIQNKSYDESSPYDEYKVKFGLEGCQIIINRFIGCRYHYYFIPKWSKPITSISIVDGNRAELETNLYNYTSRYLDDGSPVIVNFKNDVHEIYFGYGFYTNISSDKIINTVSPLYCDREYNNNINNLQGKYLWISPGNKENHVYSCSIIKDESDTHKMFVKLNNNDTFRKALVFTDSKSCVSLRNFSPNDANNNWIIGEKNVLDTYEYNTPVTTRHKNVYAAPIIKKLYNRVLDLYDVNVTVRWKIYKRIGLSNRKMIMECYNKVIALNLIDTGMYDIEVEIFDEYGNKYTKEMGSAISRYE